MLHGLLSQGTSERLCGAFHHLSFQDLQAYLLTLWADLIPSLETYIPGSGIPTPWNISGDIVSAIIHPTVSPTDMLQHLTFSETHLPSYSNGISPSILSKVQELITITEDNYRALLRALRRGFALRFLLDNRDIYSGPCHNMLWTMSHLVSFTPKCSVLTFFLIMQHYRTHPSSNYATTSRLLW